MAYLFRLLIISHFRFLVWRQTSGDSYETLWVEISAELDSAREAVDDFIDETEEKLEGMGDTADRATDKIGSGSKRNAGMAAAAFGVMFAAGTKVLDVALRLAQVVPNFFMNSARQAIAANQQFETFSTQFETLLGSSGAAQERLEELARFGVETPFELPEIVEASRQLEVFGGSAIATGDNLRLIGDLAAGVNQPIQGVAFWIGRMYDAMQNGQPFGEASMRLQEMGILSGDVRRKIEEMAKSGEDGAKVFEFFASQVGEKFAGNMARLSGTLGGVQSNLADFQGNLLRVSGQELFEEFRQANIDFLEMLNENEAEITEIGKGIGGIFADILRLGRELLSGFDIKPVLASVKDFIERLSGTSKAAGAVIVQVKGLISAFSPLLAIFRIFNTSGSTAWLTLENIEKALITLAQALALAKAGWMGIFAAMQPIGTVIAEIGKAFQALYQLDFEAAAQHGENAMERIKDGLIDVQAGQDAYKDSILESAEQIDRMTGSVEDLGDAIEDTKNTGPIEPEDIIEEPDAIAEQLESLSNQMLDAVEQRDEALEAAQERHNDRMASIVQQGVDRLNDINAQYNENVATLRAETNEREAEITANAQAQLAQLRESTDKQLNDRRKNFNEKEKRETEDHLRELRRLEDDYLLNLSDAVRKRDARAIIDLQRNFNKAKDQKQEDFDLGQGRDRQDFSQELNEIRQNERERRDEILAAQAEQINDLRAHEQERFDELTQKRDEDVENLRQQQAAKLQAERDSFDERKAALDEALQERLASIAKSLSDQNDVTEEGARHILETFNEYFGIGGDIDKMMDDFVKRRNQRMEIEVKFKETRPAPRPRPQNQERRPGGHSRGSSGLTQGAEAEQVDRTSGGITAETGYTSGPSGAIPFAGGGSILATKPTLALLAENEPELHEFTPLSLMPAKGMMGGNMQVDLNFNGSAPPGVGVSHRDQIAAVVIDALEESGVYSVRGS